jgi:general secretion pathway protein C
MKRAFMKFDSSYFWSARYAKWIIFSLVSIFGLLIIVEIVSYFTFQRTLNQPPTPLRQTLPTIQTEANIHELGTTLFGKYVPINVGDAEVKVSKLSVEIVGIIFSQNPKNSHVTIKTEDGEENTYSVGDTISANAVIKRILPDGILVEHNGAIESLSFPENRLSFEPALKPLIKD